MNKSVIIIAGVILVSVISIAGLVLLSRGSVSSTQTSSTVTQNSTKNSAETVPEKSPEPVSKSGIYTNYSDSALSEYTGKKVVLFFYASWCPSCRQQDGNLSSTRKDIPADLAILKVDYDSYTALRQKYGVTQQHTFVQVDANGNKLKLWNSLYNEYDLQSIVKKLI